MKRPNILFLMTDEQKFDTLGCVNPLIKTPNLDKLVENSVFFNNAYCSNPSCVPSRAAIVTGKYPTACQCPTYISILPKDEVTFMAKLQELGYYTAVVGKQHFDASEIYKGYDYECIVDGHSPGAPYENILAYAEYLKGEGVYKTKLCDNKLICGSEWIGKIEHHIDYFIGEKGKEWLGAHIDETKQASNPKPWFMTLSFPGPHQPYDCEGTAYADLYDLEDMTLEQSNVGDLETKPPHYKQLNPKAYIDQYDKETYQKTKRSYYANMSLIDEKIGEVIAMLKEKGEYDNTLIIYSTDHGDFMGDFGLVTKAQYLSEGLMHVPLFVKPPIKDFKGFRVDDLVTNIDIASTCLTVANGADKITDHMENHPYSDYWEQDEVAKRDYLYMEAHDIKGVIEHGIKVLYYVDRQYGELYDLNNDPTERVNLWDDLNYQLAKQKGMARIIDKMFHLTPKSSTLWNVNAPRI